MGESILEEYVVVKGSVRKQWPNKLQFLCANISYAVGLGNIWRFPYLAAKNGGGTFLIPYFISLVFIGIPLFITELSIGQRLRAGPIEAYKKFHPGFAGIGVAMAAISFFVGCYYNMISGWALFYVLNSFQNPLPWASCPNIIQNVSLGASMIEIPMPVPECSMADSTNYFWYRGTLNISGSLSDIAGVQMPMILCLLLAWVIVFNVMMNGSESSGGQLYFIAFFPYVVLTLFLIMGLIQDGGPEGLVVLMTPDWTLMQEGGIWIDAASQIFYSFGVCFGGLIAFSSYNAMNENLIKNGLIVAGFNCGTSVFAALVIFALLGGQAMVTFNSCVDEQEDFLLGALNQAQDFFGDKTYAEVFSEYGELFGLTECNFDKIVVDDIPQGTGLTFIAIAGAVVNFPASYIFAILFYFLITILGIGSMIGTLEGVLTPIADAFLNYDSLKNVSKRSIMLVLCILHFSIGVLFTTGAGTYWLDIFNDYSANINLLTVGCLQYIVVYWVFGAAAWQNEMSWMLQSDSKAVKAFTWYLRICATFISPILIILILGFFVYDMSTNAAGYREWDASIGAWAQDGNGTDIIFAYDAAGTAMIILLHVVVLIWIPFFLVKALFKNGTFSFSNWRKHDDAIIFAKKQQ